MQEVTVKVWKRKQATYNKTDTSILKPRSCFKHYVTIDSKNKDLTWSFCTTKKNISFGLYKKLDYLTPQGAVRN